VSHAGRLLVARLVLAQGQGKWHDGCSLVIPVLWLKWMCCLAPGMSWLLALGVFDFLFRQDLRMVRLAMLKAACSTTRRVVGRAFFFILQEVCVCVCHSICRWPKLLSHSAFGRSCCDKLLPPPPRRFVGLRVLLQCLLGLKAFAVAHVCVFCLFAFGFFGVTWLHA